MLISLDERKRVPLGKILRTVKSKATLFNAEMVDGKIVLEPVKAVPEREAWLHDAPEALASVRQGLSEKPQHKLPDMSEYLDENE